MYGHRSHHSFVRELKLCAASFNKKVEKKNSFVERERKGREVLEREYMREYNKSGIGGRTKKKMFKKEKKQKKKVVSAPH